NFAFVDATLLSDWNLDAGSVALANPLSAELGVMRTSLLPGLVQSLGRNVARQQSRVRLSEIGKVFTSREPVAGRREAGAPVETLRVAAAACGPAVAEQWGVAERDVDFHDVKGDLDSLAALARAELEYRPSTAAWGHPGRSADVFRNGARIGWIGQLH